MRATRGQSLGVGWRNIRLAELRLIVEADKDLITASLAPHLTDGGSYDVVDKAILGLGVLDEKHYFFRDQGLRTDPIADQLRQIRNEISVRDPGAIASAAENFWLVSDHDLPPELARDASRIIDDLNEKVVTITPTQLSRAPMRVLVTGGESKYRAVRDLINGCGPADLAITGLVTTAKLAQWLLDDP